MVFFLLSSLLLLACGKTDEDSVTPAASEPSTQVESPSVTEPPPEVEPPSEVKPTAEVMPTPEVDTSSVVETPTEVEENPVDEISPEPDEAPVLTQENNEEEKEKSFIWQVSSDVSTIYLLGSIHVASFGIYPLDSTIEDAFKIADNLVVEVNVKEVDEMETTELMLEHGIYSEGDGLRKNVPKDIYEKLDEYFWEWGIDIAALDMFRPWVIYLMMEQLRMEELNCSQQYGIDVYFIEKAIRDEKDIFELETAVYQIKLLRMVLDDLMFLMLEEDLTDPITQEDYDFMLEAWEDGDVEKMESIVFEGLANEPGLAFFYEKMYDERNIRMANKIEGFLADKETYFVVVGAGHLVGENGLVSILDDRGYEVVQLYDSD